MCAKSLLHWQVGSLLIAQLGFLVTPKLWKLWWNLFFQEENHVPSNWNDRVFFVSKQGDLHVLETLTADTYFPAVTNISSRHLEKVTVVAFPTLRSAAGLPQMASLLSMLQTTTLPGRKDKKSQGEMYFQNKKWLF